MSTGKPAESEAQTVRGSYVIEKSTMLSLQNTLKTYFLVTTFRRFCAHINVKCHVSKILAMKEYLYL